MDRLSKPPRAIPLMHRLQMFTTAEVEPPPKEPTDPAMKMFYSYIREMRARKLRILREASHG